MTPAERVKHYAEASGYPQGLFVGDDGRIAGSWIMGQNYTVKSGLYGGYPHGYLRRIAALFPDKSSILHLFSGMVDQSVLPGKTVDINPARNPDYLDDAQSLEQVPLETFDLILADPPYSHEDAEKYGVTLIKANKVMKALERVKPGTHIVWLDQRLPMYRKECFRTIGYIGMVKSTNHRFRCITIFERV
jgi:hypothetical protein